MLKNISIRGAREHNLKNIDVEIPRDTLTVLLPTPLLPPGRYTLRLEGERAGGGNTPAGEYPFQVERSR
jgi:hypothetical protein